MSVARNCTIGSFGKWAAALALCVWASSAAAQVLQLPFPCGETWTVSTWSGHSPALAADLNCCGAGDADLGKPVVASAAGTVTVSEYATTTGYGNHVKIDHGNGWVTHYAHLDAREVSVGQRVAQGQRIGFVGKSSAKYTFSAHLHYEQIYGGTVRELSFDGVAFPYYAKRDVVSRNCPITAPPQPTAASGTIRTSGAPLSVRSDPSTSNPPVGTVANGAKVSIYCQTYGQRIVSSTYGASSIWDRIGDGQYVSDVYVYTGTSGLVAPLCP